MRITNSMMINNVLTDLNSGLIRQNKYFQQLASNRKMVNLSDNPVGLVNSLTARQNLRQIAQYRDNIVTTRKWTQQAETSVMDMQSIIVKIKENVVDAGGTKNETDRNNIAALVKELKEHLFETLNTAVGDKFIFGGYNSTKKPFTMDKDGNVLYNGLNLADTAPKAGAMNPSGDVITAKLTGSVTPPDDYKIEKLSANQIKVTNAAGTLEKTIDLSEAKIHQVPVLDNNGEPTTTPTTYKNTMDIELNGLKLGTLEWETTVEEKEGQSTLEDAIDTLVSVPNGKITNGLYETMTDIVIDPKNPLTAQGGVTSIDWEGPITAGDKYYIEPKDNTITIKDSDGVEIVKAEITAGQTELDLTSYGLGTIKWSGGTPEDAAASIASAGYVTTKLGEEASQNIQFEIGYQIKMDATFTGIDLVGLGEDNLFKVIDDLIADLEAGAGNDDLTKYLTRLTTVQDKLLTCGVELGARSQKLDTMENRYSLDNINAEAVRGNVEDIDQAETIMNMKFAEAIYRQALAAGAMIIQPTLMDFLN